MKQRQEERWLRSFMQCEAPLRFFVLTILGLLVLVQVALQHEPVRKYLSHVDRLEGDPVTLEAPQIVDLSRVVAQAAMQRDASANDAVRIWTVPAQSLPEVKIYVDGKQAADLTHGWAWLPITHESRIELDATRYPSAVNYVAERFVSLDGTSYAIASKQFLTQGNVCVLDSLLKEKTTR